MVVTLVLMLALPFGFSDCLSPTTTPSLLSRQEEDPFRVCRLGTLGTGKETTTQSIQSVFVETFLKDANSDVS